MKKQITKMMIVILEIFISVSTIQARVEYDSVYRMDEIFMIGKITNYANKADKSYVHIEGAFTNLYNDKDLKVKKTPVSLNITPRTKVTSDRDPRLKEFTAWTPDPRKHAFEYVVNISLAGSTRQYPIIKVVSTPLGHDQFDGMITTDDLDGRLAIRHMHTGFNTNSGVMFIIEIHDAFCTTEFARKTLDAPCPSVITDKIGEYLGIPKDKFIPVKVEKEIKMRMSDDKKRHEEKRAPKSLPVGSLYPRWFRESEVHHEVGKDGRITVKGPVSKNDFLFKLRVTAFNKGDVIELRGNIKSGAVGFGLLSEDGQKWKVPQQSTTKTGDFTLVLRVPETGSYIPVLVDRSSSGTIECEFTDVLSR